MGSMAILVFTQSHIPLGFPQIRGTISGVPVTWITVYLGLHLGTLFSGNYHLLVLCMKLNTVNLVFQSIYLVRNEGVRASGRLSGIHKANKGHKVQDHFAKTMQQHT